jgi:glycosyltransferase involved in cell wall biosynthesis
MKLGYVAPYSSSFSLSANSVHVFKMCDAYASLGINTQLFLDGLNSQTKPNPDYSDIFDLSYDFSVCSISSLNFFRTFRLIFLIPNKLKSLGVNLVHTRNVAVAFGSAVLFGIPTILELHNLPPGGRKVGFLFNSFIRSKTAKALICITQKLATDINMRYQLKCPYYVFPDGVSKKYLVGCFNRSKLKKDLYENLSESKWIVYTGSFYKGKGPDFIFELANLRPDLTFILVGNYGSLNQSFIRKNVILIGERPINEVIKYQRAADILLLPISNFVLGAGRNSEDISSYTSPLKMFEYMASKSPIIASTLPVLGEILRHNDNAIICDLDDLGKWSVAIDDLLADKNFSNKISSSAFLDVQTFTWEERAKKTLAI